LIVERFFLRWLALDPPLRLCLAARKQPPARPKGLSVTSSHVAQRTDWNACRHWTLKANRTF
jgi:hypothetical protein